MLSAIFWALLSILLWTLLALVAILLLLLALLLCLPLDLRARMDSDWAASGWDEEMHGAVRWEANFRWGWGLLAGTWTGENLSPARMELRILGRRLRGRSKQGSKRRAGREAKKRKRSRSRPDWDLIWAAAQEALRFLQKLWRDLGWRVEGDLTYGFADPSLTGWAEALRAVTGIPLSLRLTPDFLRPCLTGQANLAGRLFGYQVVVELWQGLKNPVIRNRIAGRIRFKPLRYVITRGG